MNVKIFLNASVASTLAITPARLSTATIKARPSLLVRCGTKTQLPNVLLSNVPAKVRLKKLIFAAASVLKKNQLAAQVAALKLALQALLKTALTVRLANVYLTVNASAQLVKLRTKNAALKSTVSRPLNASAMTNGIRMLRNVSNVSVSLMLILARLKKIALTKGQLVQISPRSTALLKACALGTTPTSAAQAGLASAAKTRMLMTASNAQLSPNQLVLFQRLLVLNSSNTLMTPTANVHVTRTSASVHQLAQLSLAQLASPSSSGLLKTFAAVTF